MGRTRRAHLGRDLYGVDVVTRREEQVMAAVRQALELPILGGDREVNAVLVYSLIEKDEYGRPSATQVLQTMYALARKGELVKASPKMFKLPTDAR